MLSNSLGLIDSTMYSTRDKQSNHYTAERLNTIVTNCEFKFNKTCITDICK